MLFFSQLIYPSSFGNIIEAFTWEPRNMRKLKITLRSANKLCLPYSGSFFHFPLFCSLLIYIIFGKFACYSFHLKLLLSFFQLICFCIYASINAKPEGVGGPRAYVGRLTSIAFPTLGNLT